ncbi:MAG: HAD family hydrolase [Gammaproteobacteria bacterium]
MLEIAVPGYKTLCFEHLVLDYNGTLACDGKLIKGVEDRLASLSDQLKIHILTADTFGEARSGLDRVVCELSILHAGEQDRAKLDYIQALNPDITVCVGNGRNDRLMLKQASLGIAVILAEGAAMETLDTADIVCTDICSALDLLLNPLRLIATLRS